MIRRPPALAALALATFAALAAPPARADEVRRDLREQAADRRELRQDRAAIDDDERDLARLQQLLAALDAAGARGDRAAVLRLDTDLERELAAEARETRLEAARGRLEQRRDRQEVREERREGDRAGARDERRDRRDDRHDTLQEKRLELRREAIGREWAGLRGRTGPADLAARRSLLLELIELARREVRGDHQEIREDRRELREDRRETREDEAKRR
jgi:hypothetical protein